MMDAQARTQRCPSCSAEQPASYRYCATCGVDMLAPATAATNTGWWGDAQPANMAMQVKGEIEELQSIAAAFGVKRIRDGSWFNEFIKAMLDTYAERIISGGGIALFRAKYPGLTRDQIAEKLCELATNYAAIAGGASGAAASAAFAATIGTAGGAGVIAVPAGVLAVMAEMLYTTRLQIRLVYDLSIIYGCPIDTTDPEDLYKAFCMAYGIAFAAGNAGAAVKAATPEIARAQLRALIQGNTAAIQQVAIRMLGPRIGREITQRSILRAAVPVVGIGISATWNYAATNAIATTARYGLRVVGRLRDAVGEVATQLAAQPAHYALVLESMLVAITADERFDQYEQEVFQCVVHHLKPSPEVLNQIENRVSISTSSVALQLRDISDPELRSALATCLQIVAVADGVVVDAEVQVLRQLLAALQQDLDLSQLHDLARPFQRPKSWAEQAGDSMSAFGDSASEVFTSWFGRRKQK